MTPKRTPKWKISGKMSDEEFRVSIVKYVDTRFDAVADGFCVINEKIDLVDKAITERLNATEKVISTRFENVNEWRATVTDLIEQVRGMIAEIKEVYMPRAEYNVRHEKISADIQDLRDFKVKVDSKASQSSVTINFVITIIGLLIGLAGLILAYADKFITH